MVGSTDGGYCTYCTYCTYSKVHSVSMMIPLSMEEGDDRCYVRYACVLYAVCCHRQCRSTRAGLVLFQGARSNAKVKWLVPGWFLISDFLDLGGAESLGSVGFFSREFFS